MNFIRIEGNSLLKLNRSLIALNEYMIFYQFKYIYVNRKALYGRIIFIIYLKNNIKSKF